MVVALAVDALERDVLLLQRRAASIRFAPPAEQREFNREVAEVRKQAAVVLSERMVEQRPEVISRGAPFLGGLARAGQSEARRRLEQTRGFKAACSDCPAANVSRETSGGVRVLCRVEGTELSSRTDPQSLLTFCLGNHRACPSWVMERERG